MEGVLAVSSGAPVRVVARVLRDHLNLSAVPIAHALHVDAATVMRSLDDDDVAVAAATLWAKVQPTVGAVDVPDPSHGWDRHAACAGRSPSIWYCEDDDCEAETEAVRTCVTCPVVGDCALAAMFENHGIWAGITQRGRRDLRRYLRLRVVPATPSGIAPLVTDMALSALKSRQPVARLNMFAVFDGTLFPLPPPVTAAAVPQRRRRRRRPVATPALVVC